ncbi:hypothetical protein ACS0TY_003108 [Phlomoides rotata]
MLMSLNSEVGGNIFISVNTQLSHYDFISNPQAFEVYGKLLDGDQHRLVEMDTQRTSRFLQQPRLQSRSAAFTHACCIIEAISVTNLPILQKKAHIRLNCTILR